MIIYTTEKKLWDNWKAQWKHSYLTFWFAGNGLAPTTNRYCDINATIKCNVMDENCNLQCPKLKINIKNVQECVICLYFA